MVPAVGAPKLLSTNHIDFSWRPHFTTQSLSFSGKCPGGWLFDGRDDPATRQAHSVQAQMLVVRQDVRGS